MYMGYERSPINRKIPVERKVCEETPVTMMAMLISGSTSDKCEKNPESRIVKRYPAVMTGTENFGIFSCADWYWDFSLYRKKPRLSPPIALKTG